jgi:hypothetical protein
MPKNACTNQASSSCSGGTEGRSSAAYSAQKVGLSRSGARSAAAGGWPGCAPRSRRWRTGSRCAPADLTFQLGHSCRDGGVFHQTAKTACRCPKRPAAWIGGNPGASVHSLSNPRSARLRPASTDRARWTHRVPWGYPDQELCRRPCLGAWQSPA